MNIDSIREKVTKAEEQVAKIEKLIEKYKVQKQKKINEVNKLLADNGQKTTYEELLQKHDSVRYLFQDAPFRNDFYWACCDVDSKEDGIKSNTQKLEEAKTVLKNWQEKLRLEEVKIQYIQDSVPQVIKDFLEEWKTRVIQYYHQKAEEYPEAYKTYKEERDRLYFDVLKETVERLVMENREEFIKKYCYGREERLTRILDTLNDGYKPDNRYEYTNLVYFNYRDRNDPDEHPRYVRHEEAWKARFGDAFFVMYESRNFDNDWLETQIEEEKKNKLIDLMTRVSKITGEIVDASYLYIANDGNINGYIIGKDGKAEVETIGAGGYNIQIFHYRVLIKPKK